MSKCKHFFAHYSSAATSIGLFGQGTDLEGRPQQDESLCQSRSTFTRHPSFQVFRVSTAQKLASRYRLTNAWAQAEALLDSWSSRIGVRDGFFTGEFPMSNGKYDQARDWFLKYAAAQPGDTLAPDPGRCLPDRETFRRIFRNVRYDRLPFNSEEDDHAAIPGEQACSSRPTDHRPPSAQGEVAMTVGTISPFFETYPSPTVPGANPGDTVGINEDQYQRRICHPVGRQHDLYFTRNTVEPNKRGVYPPDLYLPARRHQGGPGPGRYPCLSGNQHDAPCPARRRADDDLCLDRSGGPGGLDLWMVEWSVGLGSPGATG